MYIEAGGGDPNPPRKFTRAEEAGVAAGIILGAGAGATLLIKSPRPCEFYETTLEDGSTVTVSDPDPACKEAPNNVEELGMFFGPIALGAVVGVAGAHLIKRGVSSLRHRI